MQKKKKNREIDWKALVPPILHNITKKCFVKSTVMLVILLVKTVLSRNFFPKKFENFTQKIRLQTYNFPSIWRKIASLTEFLPNILYSELDLNVNYFSFLYQSLFIFVTSFNWKIIKSTSSRVSSSNRIIFNQANVQLVVFLFQLPR